MRSRSPCEWKEFGKVSGWGRIRKLSFSSSSFLRREGKERSHQALRSPSNSHTDARVFLSSLSSSSSSSSLSFSSGTSLSSSIPTNSPMKNLSSFLFGERRCLSTPRQRIRYNSSRSLRIMTKKKITSLSSSLRSSSSFHSSSLSLPSFRIATQRGIPSSSSLPSSSLLSSFSSSNYLSSSSTLRPVEKIPLHASISSSKYTRQRRDRHKEHHSHISSLHSSPTSSFSSLSFFPLSSLRSSSPVSLSSISSSFPQMERRSLSPTPESLSLSRHVYLSSSFFSSAALIPRALKKVFMSPSFLSLQDSPLKQTRGFAAGLTRDSVDIVPPLDRLEGFLLSNLPVEVTSDSSLLLRLMQRAGIRVAPSSPTHALDASSINTSSTSSSSSSRSSGLSEGDVEPDQGDKETFAEIDRMAVEGGASILVQRSRLNRSVGRCLVLPSLVDLAYLGADGARRLQKHILAVIPHGSEVTACDEHDVQGYIEEFERYFHLTEDLQRLAKPENLRRVVSLSPVPSTYGRREVRDVLQRHAGIHVDHRDIVFRFRKDGVQGDTCYVVCQSERDAGVAISRIQETPVPNRVQYDQLFGCSFLWANRANLFLSHPSLDYLPGRSPFQIFTTGWEGDVQESEFANLAYQLRLFPKAVRRFYHEDTDTSSFFLEFHRMRDAKLAMSRLQLLRKRWRVGSDSPFFGFVRMADLRFEDEEKFADEDSAADSDLDEPIDY